MSPRLLILGGTTEGAALARAAADAGLAAEVSLAGRVARPAPLPLPVRIGGFGGAEGLARHLRDGGFTHMIDATHPFAARISANAAAAAAATGVAFAALTRPPWRAGPGDRWTEVADHAAAAAALGGAHRRVFLAIGRAGLDGFPADAGRFYLLRLVDPPRSAPPFARCAVVVDRGPFDAAGDLALLRDHRIDVLVAKNAGGDGARAKLDAARALGLPVVMIARPPAPRRREVATPGEALDWIAHGGADLGV